jgi:hypothetical protein
MPLFSPELYVKTLIRLVRNNEISFVNTARINNFLF